LTDLKFKRLIQRVSEIWSGFLRGIGAIVATGLLCFIGTLIRPLRALVEADLGRIGTQGTITLTISLVVSILALLGLLIWSLFSYFALIRKAQGIKKSKKTMPAYKEDNSAMCGGSDRS
jgi:hypothetical protein